MTWIIALASFGAGLGIGVAGNEDTEARTVTVTSIVERRVEVPAATEAAPATTKPKPQPAATRPPTPTFGEGLYEVGKEIQAGTYKTAGDAGGCYYARLKTDDTSSYIANHLGSGPITVRVRTTDGFVEFSGPCEWRRVG